ncbi:MBL fold metallo-hydrolase [Streptomyces avicenniae]|uniref:MBL fold metallo-hydrolase n=1 Tax=Streptomyces avicenniae TaxID=500153 RepID=UPI00069ABEE6|nr:MBL fold metallo-hydrolase [Streptomyces avicenniae]
MSTERLRRPASRRSLRLGETTVTHLPDGVVQLSVPGWLSGSTAADWRARADHLDASGYLVASIGGLLVERDGRALLIDAGVGPVAAPARAGARVGALRGGDLPASLAAVGLSPAAVEAVAFTHLHIDHVGWAWHTPPGADRPLLAHAPYLFSEPEWRERALAGAEGPGPDVLAALEPSVRTVPDGEEIFPGVRLQLRPGHTSGHASYVIEGGGRRLIAFGDALHSPAQISHPEWSAAPDIDREAGVRSRRDLVRELSEPGTLGYGGHFADVVFGRVVPGQDGPRWQPVDS